jgi:hypothetical protein
VRLELAQLERWRQANGRGHQAIERDAHPNLVRQVAVAGGEIRIGPVN